VSDRIRVLVVDDSAVMRKLIPQMLDGDRAIEVVGTAMDGLLGLKKIGELRPDVVTLDLDMPRMDGMEMLHEIVARHHIPVIVVSAHTEAGAYSALKALAEGAFDFVAKPRDSKPSSMEQMARDLLIKIKVAAIAGPPKHTFEPITRQARKYPRVAKEPTRAVRTIAVGVSTGGPNALHYVFSLLPGDFSGCLIVVQHMPEGFTEMFARRLNDCSPIEVVEARSADLIVPGRAYVCPGNRHIRVRSTPRGSMIVLDDHAQVNGHRPSADVLFHSVARELRREAVALLMTGMGEDGAEGMGAVQAAGGVTLAQSPESCVVDSMPRSAIDRGYVGSVVTLEQLPTILSGLCNLEMPRSRPELETTPASGSSRESKFRRRSS
jgi:two-component system chemotaxis response regulator CheB